MILKNTRTSDVVRHLRDRHNLDINPQRIIAVKRSIDRLQDDDEDTTSSRSQSEVRQLIQTLNVHNWRRYLIRWIVRRHVTFSAVEDEDFKAMLVSLNQSIEPYLISDDTVWEWIELAFLRTSSLVKELIASALSRVHISFDLWSSPNGYGICGICAHFIDSEYRNRSILIAMKRMLFTHSSEAMAEVIIPVMTDYGVVGDRIRVFVADNAEVNDVAIKIILKQLRPDLDPQKRRGRCLGHILNLAAQAFLFGKNVEAFEELTTDINDATPMETEKMKKAQKAWRDRGSVGKLHNIVAAIRQTPQRRERFRNCRVGDHHIDG
jgi:hypothetical protein